jgi:hypothetical protein
LDTPTPARHDPLLTEFDAASAISAKLSMLKSYYNIVRWWIRIATIGFIAIAGLIFVLAALDLLLGIGWGYTWYSLTMILGMTALALIVYRVSLLIIDAIASE